MDSFDLVREPWIPCIDRKGKRLEVGLRRALVDAHLLLGLHDDSPLATSGLIRLLLAVLHAALDGPSDLDEWTEVWEAGRFEERAIEKYLQKWHKRFDLFHAATPFFQIGELEMKNVCPVTKLAHERATGNNAVLFSHDIEERPQSMSSAEAARQLVGNQSYALGGGVSGTSIEFGRHRNFTHAPMIGGASVFLEGANLFETLALNLLAGERSSIDRPTWEEGATPKPKRRKPVGHLEFLTWRSRFVRLVPDDDGGVTEMHYAQGWEYDRSYLNPFFAYVAAKKGGLFPITLRDNRAPWRDSTAFLVGAQGNSESGRRPLALDQAVELVKREILDPERALHCLVIGLANDKAKPLFWREERFSVPMAILRDEVFSRALLAGITRAEEVGRALRSAVGLFRARLKGAVPGAQERAEVAYWAALESRFSTFIFSLTRGNKAAVFVDFVRAVDSAARTAYNEITDSAVRWNGREIEARVAGQGLLSYLLKKEPDDATN